MNNFNKNKDMKNLINLKDMGIKEIFEFIKLENEIKKLFN